LWPPRLGPSAFSRGPTKPDNRFGRFWPFLDALDEILLGSSEVIESAIGKFKTLEHDQVKSGFTSMLLSFSAFLSRTTKEVIQAALQAVPTKKIGEWFKENIGRSVQSQRKEILELARGTE